MQTPPLLLNNYWYNIILLCTLLLLAGSCVQNPQERYESMPPLPVQSANLTENKIDYLTGLISQGNSSAELYFRRSLLYLKAEKENLALRDAEAAIASDSGKAEYFLVKSRALDMKEEYAEAYKAVKKALSLGDKSADLLFLMGKFSYLQDQNLNTATGYLDQSLSINNLNAEAYYYKGKIYREQNDTLQAAQMFKQAIGIKPQFAQSYHELVDMYASVGRFDLGLPYALAGTRLCPDDASLQYQAGWMLSNLGRESEAMLWYQKAHKTDPSIWRASYQLGMYQLKQREYQVASQYLKEALRYKSDIERVSFILGAINEYQLRNYEEALLHYEKAIILEPQNEELQDAISRMKRRIAYEEYKKSPQYILDQMRKRQQEEAEKLIQGNNNSENN